MLAGESIILEGHLSIEAALEAGYRDLHEILIAERKRYNRRAIALMRRVAAAGIPADFAPDDRIDSLANGTSHGGILARVGARRFCELEDLLQPGSPPLVVMLDGIEDPYNFAGVVRALYAAGVAGIALRPRNWTSAAALVGRASAGAIERMPLALADDAETAARFFSGRGLRIAIAAKSEDALPIYQADLTGPLFLLLGGERRGVTRSFLQSADLKLQIPYARTFAQSLGTVGAAAVIAFEIMRQRNFQSASAK